MRPPFAFTKSAHIAKPKPVPLSLPVPCWLRVSESLKSVSCTSCGIPVPESFTEISSISPESRDASIIVPSAEVYLMALVVRLRTTTVNMSRSVYICCGSMRFSKIICLLAAIACKLSVTERLHSCASNYTGAGTIPCIWLFDQRSRLSNRL